MVLQTEKGIVNLSGMEIRHFPDEGVVAFEACGGECLDLSNNLLTSLPCTLRKSDVKIDGNSLSLIPESARGSWAKIRTYLDSVSDRATRWSECKLLLVGQEGVGKTYVSFPSLSRFFSVSFCPFPFPAEHPSHLFLILPFRLLFSLFIQFFCSESHIFFF